MKDDERPEVKRPAAETPEASPQLSAEPLSSSMLNPASFETGHAFLKRLLSERNQYPERSAEIDGAIRRAFERRVAILALDMSGFSRLTLELGIIHYLAMIHQMHEAAAPAVTGNGGKIIKFEADNLFAIFNDAAGALEGALDIFRAFNAVNSVLPRERHIYGSIGIGYGETLVLDGEDMFGAEMNIACKLGEDIATRDEILLTAAAYDSLPADHYHCEPINFSLGEMGFKCYRYERTLRPKKPANNP
jgi:class 3 adenylate cyclase